MLFYRFGSSQIQYITLLILNQCPRADAWRADWEKPAEKPENGANILLFLIDIPKKTLYNIYLWLYPNTFLKGRVRIHGSETNRFDERRPQRARG